MSVTADSADDAPFFEIHKYGDLTSVAVAVRGSGAVIVDFRSVDDAMGRRVADFCAGLGFGIGNSPFRLTDRVYFLSGQRTPNRAERARFAG